MKKSMRVLSLVLAMMMLFSAFSILASAKSVDVADTGATIPAGQVLYLKPNSNWTQANAWFAAYIWDSSSTFVKAEACPRDSGYYKVTIPAGTWKNIIWCRMNSSATTADWNNVWNQTSDLTWDGTNCLYTVGSGAWSKGSGSWSAWTETPEPTEAETEAPSEDEPIVDPEQPTEAPTEAETEAPTEPIAKTVYAIDSMKWGKVSAHAWVLEDTSITTTWPGTAMTKTEETVNGFDVYEITFDVDYNSIIFNNNNGGQQTADLTLEEGKYYDIKAGAWYDSLADVPVVDPLSTDRYLVGSFNGWSTLSHEFKLDAEGSSTGYVSIDLEANTTYEFKVVREGTWTSNSTAITGDKSGLTFSSSVSGNAKITTKAAGTYVFSFGMTNSQLAVTYPVEPTEEPTEAPTEPEATFDEPQPTEPEATEPEEEPTEAPDIEYITVYFQNNWLWTDIYAYTWNADGAYEAAWPGAKMEFYANDGNYDVYMIKIPAGNSVIFNGIKDDGTGTRDESPAITDAVDGRCYYMLWDNGNAVGYADINVIVKPEEPTEAPEFPEFVSGLTVGTVTETSIDLTWDRIAGAQKYWVWINGAVKYATTDTAITIKADSNTTYELAVTAKLADDTIQLYANAEKVEATTPATVADEFTYEVSASSTTNSVTVDWTMNVDTKAWVYLGTSADDLKYIYATTDTSFTFTNLNANTTYFYKVRYIVDGVAFESEVTEIKTDEFTVNLDVDVVNTSVKVDWLDYENATKYWIITEANGKQLIYATYVSEFTIPYLVFDYEIRALVDGKVVTIY